MMQKNILLNRLVVALSNKYLKVIIQCKGSQIYNQKNEGYFIFLYYRINPLKIEYSKSTLKAYKGKNDTY